MKKNKSTIVLILLTVFGLLTFSCTKDFTEVNTDPIGERSTDAHQLLAPALVNILIPICHVTGVSITS